MKRRLLSFAFVGVASGAGVMSMAVNTQQYPDESFGILVNNKNSNKAKKKTSPDYRKNDDVIAFGHFGVVKSYLTSTFQRPSNRLSRLISLANNKSVSVDVRCEAVRVIATYWRQWPKSKRELASKAMSPDVLAALTVYGHRIDSSFFPVPIFGEKTWISFDQLESAYIASLRRLSQASDLRLDPCSTTFLSRALRDVEQLNDRLKKEKKSQFGPNLEFWPFDAHVDADEGFSQEASYYQEPSKLVGRKLEMLLTPILKCLEHASRRNDHFLAGAICDRLDLFKLLSQTVRLDVSDNVRRLLSAILANLSSFSSEKFADKQRKVVVESGFLPLLRSWALDDGSQPQNKTVAYEAIRALKNLDPFFQPKLKNSVGLYFPIWRNVFSPEVDQQLSSGVDVVFVHGVQGGPVHTWRLLGDSASAYRSKTCWPADWLPFDVSSKTSNSSCNSKNAGQTMRFFGIQYYSVLPGLGACLEPLIFRARHIMQDLEMSGIGASKNRRIVWITHSFGGIFVKSILLQNQKIADKTAAVVFLSTPHSGSPIADQPAKYASILGLAWAELEEIRTGSPHLLQLREAFADLAASHRYDVLSVSEQAPTRLLGLTLSAVVVPEQSAFDARCGQVMRSPENTDHLSTCKPKDKSCPTYTSILNIINKASSNK